MAEQTYDRDFFVKSGRKGAVITNNKLTAKERSEAARKAVKARWAEHKKNMKQIDKSLASLGKTTRKLDTMLSGLERRSRRSKQKKITAPK
jgi:hypothetical protein